MRQFESLGQYHDFWGWILLSAPDSFRSYDLDVVDQKEELEKAFEDLRQGFYLAKKSLKDERTFRIAQELIEMSFEAYASGDSKTGAHALQECEGLVWKSGACKIKYAVEAEKRAFGENKTYVNIKVSPYPYEGNERDLGSDQSELLKHAERFAHLYLSKWREFSFFSWVMKNDGTIQRISPEPKEDESFQLKPVQKSMGACHRRAKALAESDQIRAYVIMNIIGPQGDGLVSYDLEQKGLPRISARQLFKLLKGPSHEFGSMKFHIEDPQVFTND